MTRWVVLWGLWCASQAWAEPQWYAPGHLQVGAVNEAYGWNQGSVPEFSVDVVRPGTTRPLADAPGFAQDQPLFLGSGTPANFHWSAALVCPDALEAAGPVTIRFWGPGRHLLASVPSVIDPRVFPVEEIPLDKTMSQLREKPDPRKDREWAQIWGVYTSFDPSFRWAAGHFTQPVPEGTRLSARFGDTRHYDYSDGATSRDYHRGVDFAVPVGTPILAPAPGRVALVADRMLTGHSLVLEHGPGVYSVYFHLSQALVHPGETVVLGQKIALSGATGFVTGPHLHWEIRVNGVSVDPLPLVSQGLLDTVSVGKIISSFERPSH